MNLKDWSLVCSKYPGNKLSHKYLQKQFRPFPGARACPLPNQPDRNESRKELLLLISKFYWSHQGLYVGGEQLGIKPNWWIKDSFPCDQNIPPSFKAKRRSASQAMRYFLIISELLSSAGWTHVIRRVWQNWNGANSEPNSWGPKQIPGGCWAPSPRSLLFHCRGLLCAEVRSESPRIELAVHRLHRLPKWR